MTFIKKWWSSVFVKFSTAFLLVGLIPLVSLSVFSLQAFTGHVEQFTVNNLKQMSLYMSYNVNNFFSDYDEITRLMYTGRYEGYSHTISIDQTANVNEFEQINNVPIDGFLRTLLYSDKHIRSVYFMRAKDGRSIIRRDKVNRFKVTSCPLLNGQIRWKNVLINFRSYRLIVSITIMPLSKK